MSKRLAYKYIFTPGASGVGNVKIPGCYTLDKLLLITNVTDNKIIYNFADLQFAGTTATFTEGGYHTDADWYTIDQAYDGYTTFTLNFDTSTMSATDKLQVYVEDFKGDGAIVRPYQFGTDAIERMRVSNPLSQIDADFEYGLQPTKWAGYGTVKGYPSAYDEAGVDLTVTTITTDYTTTSSTNSLITIVFDDVHDLLVGDVVNVSGLNSGILGFSRADGNFIIESVPNTSTLTYFARGLVGTSSGQSLYTEETLAKRGGIYASASIPATGVEVQSGDSGDPTTITLNFASPHGLIPGTNIHVEMDTGTNKELASGPFFIEKTPSLTSLKYTSRGGGSVENPGSPTLYAFSNATILHRPQDGGVILSTKTPTYAATVVRQTKKYFRYQSGKGFLWSSGTLFKPNYDIQSITAGGTTIGSTITVKTDDIDHGLQPEAEIRLEGVSTSGYEDTYTVQTIVDDYTFTIAAKSTLGDTTAGLDEVCKVYVESWTGSAVRAGMFDDQNGIFFEFNGQDTYCVQRSSAQQITGTINATQNSNTITGASTRFTEQLRAGDRIIVRGMTHFITQVPNDTTIYVTPDYRGITATGIRATKITEKRIPQSRWNLDTMDGNGPSGTNFDAGKMQMIGIEYSWYGAGFIHFMIRGGDGKWVYVHRMKNNNINNEAYMRSGNLPVRYSIENDTPVTFLTAAITNSDTTIPVAELLEFSDTGTLLIDNEIITYTGKSVTEGAGNFTGCTRSATLTQYQQGSTNNLTAGPAASHNRNVGIIEISNTCSPTLSHWGSALVMDGGFDRDRGYLFNYARTDFSIGTSPVTAFAIRLAPSVSNSLTGRLGAKELLNRSQLLLETIQITVSRGFSQGECIVQGILNPKNFVDATWQGLNLESQGGQPSFAQVVDAGGITWKSGSPSYAVPGEQVFSFVADTGRSDAITSSLDLSQLKELTGAPLGGDFKYPDGSDVLVINVLLTSGTSDASCLLRWSEAQA